MLTTRKRVGALAAAAVLATGGLAGSTATAAAAATSCPPVLANKTIYGDVFVPPGVYCGIFNTIVFGNVTASRGSILDIGAGSYVSGNVVGLEGSDLSFYGGAAVGQNVTARQPAPLNQAPFYMCNASVFGSVSITGGSNNKPSPFPITIGGPICAAFGDQTGNSIRQSLTLSNHQGPSQIYNNAIGGRLSCSGNSPAPTGGGNAATGGKYGQCSSL
jgi:hypothetical protein